MTDKAQPLRLEGEPVAALTGAALPASNRLSLPQALLACIRRRPADIALEADGHCISFAQFGRDIGQILTGLERLGARSGDRVAVLGERNRATLATLWACLFAGFTYVPLALDMPPARLQQIVRDAAPDWLLSDRDDACAIGGWHNVTDWLAPDTAAACADPLPTPRCVPDALPAYLLYTSGSTGTPKGVLVTRASLDAFCTAMDPVIPKAEQAVWLAVSSLSFDISILELLWASSRGFRVRIGSIAQLCLGNETSADTAGKLPDLGLFFFGNTEQYGAEEHLSMLLEAIGWADRNGFSTAWTPERHFGSFGGFFSNPGLLAAYLLARTERISIRAGSVLGPLHLTPRLAEDWATLDRLGQGRAGLSIAAGWNPADFVLAQRPLAERSDVVAQQLIDLRALWRGDAVPFPDPNGRFFDIRLALRQNSPLPLSMTVSHRPEQFEAAAEQGVDVLTHLLEQDMAQLAGHIERYRQAWQRHHGENSRPGRVTVMIHSFVGSDDDAATAQALPLLMRYLANAGSALRSLSTAVPDGGAPIEPELLEAAARRLISERSLICGPRSAQQRLRRLYRIGVDEVANLVDFGLPAADILASLERLGEVRDAPHGRAPAQAPVTHFQCTPSAARLLLRQPGGLSSRLNHLACWLVGGEALDDDLLRQLRLASDAPLYNVYGPTEATVWASVASIDARRCGPVSIGTPLPGTEIYLLDDRCQPVPQGVLGQLHIGGSGVAQGYWAQPATTAAAFIPSPFGPPGARLYATGDWARLTNDGTLAFAGRRDTQVKISGHRVDLAGMREVLLQHGAVADAWVHAFPGTDEAAMSVVAFVVPSTDGDASLVNALHDHLALHWEVGVVPRHIVVLDELPLTLSQKMDLRRLGDLYRRFLAEHKHPDALPAEDALAGAMLQTLRSLWQAILPAFDGHADFHRAGGNSLLAMQLLARANAQFNVQTSLLEFYRAPTLRGHWKAVQEATRRAGGITLAPVPRVGVYPVSFAQRAMLILDHMSAAHSSYHDDVTLRLNGQLSPDALRVAYASLLQRHRLFTTAYRFGKEDYEQVWLDDVAPDFRLATLEHAGAMDEVLRDFRDEPFDLSGGKVIRALLLQLAPTQHVLCVAVHHIASDGATLRLILDELLEHYRRCMAGSPPAATPAHWQYVDFVDWQRRRLAARQGELEAFWDTQLARRQAEPPAQAGKRDAAPVAAEWAVEIPGAQTHLVEALARRFQVGELTVLLAPLCLVLEQPGSGVTTIATDARNRERTEFEAVPGMMVNQILLPIQLPAAGDLRDLLQACNHQLVQCLGHQEFPYERLASRWHKRSPDFDAPLFDVKLVLNDPRRDVQVEGLQVEEYRIAARVAKFGILVNLQRDGHRYTGTIVFDSSRHHREAVRALWADYLAALEQLPELTDVREVRRNLATRREERSRALQSGRLAPLQAARRRAAAPASALLRTFPASDDCPVPRIEPARAEQPLAPALLPERRRIVELVRQHGAALLRGFSQVTPATLDEVVQALCGSPLPYVERSTPRTELGNKLYSATEYPAHQGIELHNENSYAAQWPGTLFFWCARPAVAGGENLLADSRRILELIPQDLAHKFELGGVLYRRELGPPLGMAWQYVFQCSTPEEVERIGHASGYNVRWHSAERVTLSRHGQAVATHPFTGERSWFNHALFFHESSLPDEIRGGLRKLYGDDYLPHQSFHGDGSSISSGEAALLRRAYRSCERTLLLHKDDILIIDNLLVAHGRCAFTGPRDIRLMMGQTMA